MRPLAALGCDADQVAAITRNNAVSRPIAIRLPLATCQMADDPGVGVRDNTLRRDRGSNRREPSVSHSSSKDLGPESRNDRQPSLSKKHTARNGWQVLSGCAIRNFNSGAAQVPESAGDAPFTFPYFPMSLPSEIGRHFGLGASIAAGDRWTSRQIFALRDECVLEHRFCPEPVFLIRSNGQPLSSHNWYATVRFRLQFLALAWFTSFPSPVVARLSASSRLCSIQPRAFYIGLGGG